MPDEAVESILLNNLFGLDIDLRAAQLARFALLMKAAAKHPGILKTKLMPRVFAMPAPEEFSRQDVLDFLGSEGLHLEEKLTAALELMQQAQNLGSVMQFDFTDEERTLVVARLDALKSKAYPDALEVSLLNRIAPYIEVLAILTRRYEAIAANPPYMGQGNMNAELKNYINTHYPDSKSDLMTVFMEVAFDLVKKGGQVGMINLPSWMFLSSFEKLRKKLVESVFFTSLIQQGRGIFGSDFGSVAFCFSKENPEGKKGVYRRLFKEHVKVDSVEVKEKRYLNKLYGYFISEQSNFGKIPGSPIAYWVSTNGIAAFEDFPQLSENFSIRSGVMTGNDNYFLKQWTEISRCKIGFNYSSIEDVDFESYRYFPLNKEEGFRKWSGRYRQVLYLKKEGVNFEEIKGLNYRLRDQKLYFKVGISWGDVTSGSISFRFQNTGLIFAARAPMIFTEDKTLIGILNSKILKHYQNIINPTLSFNLSDLDRIPVSVQYKKEIVIKLINSCIEISKFDWNKCETSWDFQTSPLFDALLGDLGMATSQFAYSRLQHAFSQGALLQQVYSEYVAQWSSLFYQLHVNEEELNRIFIDIYGLNEELDPMVPLKDITILQDELDTKALEKTDLALRRRRHWKRTEGKWQLTEDESKPLPALPIKRDVVMKQFISYAIGCMMGRYALEKPGLILANHGDTIDDYHRIIALPSESALPKKSPSGDLGVARNNEQTSESALPKKSPLGDLGVGGWGIIDDDAIIPLMGTACTFPDDAVNRFNHFLEVVWGAENLTQNKNFMQDCLDQEIEKYLVSSFWKDHCRTYKKKPIYWLFSSEKGAFQVLVYMHRMNRFTVEKIRSKYLLKHLQYLQQEIDRMAAGSSLNRDEQKRLDSLRTQYSECQRYDLLLKDCADRQIDFDLDDGITTNYELFKGVVALIK